MKTNLFFISLILLINFNFSLAQVIRDEGKSVYVDFSEKKSIINVYWENPAKDIDTVKNSQLLLKFNITSAYKISDISFLINSELKHYSDLLLTSISIQLNDSTQLIQNSFPLNKGENKFNISIKDQNGFVYFIERKIYFIPSYKTSWNDYALLFATDNYNDWKNLSNPIFDATSISDKLKDTYGFKSELITNPTIEDVFVKLREYAKRKYNENDQLFIFFAGHGIYDNVLKEGHLVCKNSVKSDSTLYKSYISYSQLRNIINNLPVNHILLVIDACYGGTFDPVVSEINTRGEEYNFEINRDEFIYRKLKLKPRRYITSGGKEYVSDGIPGHHSPFARQFLEALYSDGGSFGVLDLTGIYTYLEKLSTSPQANEFGDNQPGSDFIFVVK